MPRQNKNKNGRRGGGNRSGGGRWSAKQLACRISGFEDAYYVAGEAGTLGLLQPTSTFVSGVASDSQFATISPLTIGGRCYAIGSNFAQYRIRNVQAVYRPLNFQGVYALNTGATVTPPNGYPANLTTISSRMAAGFVKDPANGPMTYTEVIEAGGKDFNPARPFKWMLPRDNTWYYNYLRGTTAADIRQAIAANFYCISYNQGAETGQVFGWVTLHWDMEFRYPLDQTGDDVFRKQAADIEAHYVEIGKRIEAMRKAAKTPSSPYVQIDKIGKPEDSKEESKLVSRDKRKGRV
jgi:hypothetical protein